MIFSSGLGRRFVIRDRFGVLLRRRRKLPVLGYGVPILLGGTRKVSIARNGFGVLMVKNEVDQLLLTKSMPPPNARLSGNFPQLGKSLDF